MEAGRDSDTTTTDTVIVLGGSARLRKRVVHGFVGDQKNEDCVEWRIDTKYYTAGAVVCVAVGA